MSDKKIGVDANSDGTIDYYEANVITAQDYYPFGKIQSGRQYGTLARYTFNGKEYDKETKTQDYGMRIYSQDLGRFLSVDPITKEYPELTPYQFASNSPIFGIDRDGLELFGNDWLFDIWLELTFGDVGGVKTLKSGFEQKAAVQTQQMSYHNDNVPKPVQTQLDHINNVQANTKIAAGTAKVVAFNIKTSFDIISAVAPIGKGLSVTFKGAEILYGGIRAERVFIGSADKIAVIGRSMDSRVLKFAAGFEKQTGKKIETFIPDAKVLDDWMGILKKYDGKVPDEVAKASQLFKDNVKWIEKIKKEGRI